MEPNMIRDDNPQPFNVLMLGATGSGKSSIVKYLMTEEQREKHCPRVLDKDNIKKNKGGGTTESIRAYYGKTLGNKKLKIYDTRGLGDAKSSVGELLAELEDILYDVKFHAVVCVVDVPGKMNRGSDNAMMEILLKDGLMNDTLENSWGQIVLVGSMVDVIRTELKDITIQLWKDGTYNSFFENANCEGLYCFTEATEVDPNYKATVDTRELEAILAKMPTDELNIGPLSDAVLEEIIQKQITPDPERLNQILCEVKKLREENKAFRNKYNFDNSDGKKAIQCEIKSLEADREKLQKANSLSNDETKQLTLITTKLDYLSTKNNVGILHKKIVLVNDLKNWIVTKGIKKPGRGLSVPEKKHNLIWLLYQQAKKDNDYSLKGITRSGKQQQGGSKRKSSASQSPKAKRGPGRPRKDGP